MFPCRTTHTRLSPAAHSFAYSYLYVGIPVGWMGRAGTLLSADWSNKVSPTEKVSSTWFKVEAEDYLCRGIHEGGLLGKLHDYLGTQHIPIERYPYAYLVTVPRFLGIAFNPISFWYLYNRDQDLRAMILEVNNTFDERRMYFLESHQSVKEADNSTFKHEWNKDFHVSPFNSRNGSYKLSAMDPFLRKGSLEQRVDNRIVLANTGGKSRFVARVFSSETAIDAASLTKWQSLAFMFRWWWVGLMTTSRTLREARTLWMKRLKVFYRPEVNQSSIGRRATREEEVLETAFHTYLRHIVVSSSFSVRLAYVSAAGPKTGRSEVFERLEGDEGDVSELQITVLSPAFYTRFTRFANIRRAFRSLCCNIPDGEKTAVVSDFELLDNLIGVVPEVQAWHNPTWQEIVLRILRRYMSEDPPASTETSPTLGQKSGVGTHANPISEFDQFVLSSEAGHWRGAFCDAMVKLIIADRLAFGSVALLRLYRVAVSCLFLFTSAVGTRTLLSDESQCRQPGLSNPVWGILPLHVWRLSLLCWTWVR